MNSLADMLFTRHFFIHDFLEKAQQSADGYIDLSPKKSMGEGLCRIRPAGKKMVVSTTDLVYTQTIEHIAQDQPEYFYISLCRGSMRGIVGAHIKKEDVYRQHCTAGFCHCGTGVSFLPDFLDSILDAHREISPDALESAFSALHDVSLIPDAAIILKELGDAAFKGGASNLWIEAKSLELVSVVLDWHKRLTVGGPPLNEYDRLGITKALCYVEEHFSTPLSLELLAREAAMSVSKFTAAFKAHTGLSAAAYVRRFRMERALFLLKTTPHPLSDIAAMTGFQHYSNFFTLFKDQFGIAPGEVRK